MATLEIYKTLWGVEESLAETLNSLPLQGFTGVEACLLYMSKEDKDLLKQSSVNGDSHVILMLQTSGKDVASHLLSLDNQLEEAISYHTKKINIHGGLDRWSFEESCVYFEGFLALEEKYSLLFDAGVSLLHETHRGRILYSPWTSLAIFNKFPSLLLTSDLSHWVLVAERHLIGDEFLEVMNFVFRNTRHIHARPGHTQHIQLQGHSLRDPIHIDDINNFKRYWSTIFEKQIDMGHFSISSTIEFGPWPYNLSSQGSKPVYSINDDISFIKEVIQALHQDALSNQSK